MYVCMNSRQPTHTHFHSLVQEHVHIWLVRTSPNLAMEAILFCFWMKSVVAPFFKSCRKRWKEDIFDFKYLLVEEVTTMTFTLRSSIGGSDVFCMTLHTAAWLLHEGFSPLPLFRGHCGCTSSVLLWILSPCELNWYGHSSYTSTWDSVMLLRKQQQPDTYDIHQLTAAHSIDSSIFSFHPSLQCCRVQTFVLQDDFLLCWPSYSGLSPCQ